MKAQLSKIMYNLNAYIFDKKFNMKEYSASMKTRG